MFVEAPRYLFVGRIHSQREIRRQHGRRMFFRFVVRIGDRGGAIFRFPLISAGRTLGQLPFVVEQVLEETVAPFGRRLRPGDFWAAGDGVGAKAAAKFAFPAEALIFKRGAFRLRTDQRRIARAVGFAESMAAGNQCDRLLVVHRHAEERLADILGRRDRIRLAVRPFPD